MKKVCSAAAVFALVTLAPPAQVVGEIIAYTDLVLDGTVVAPSGTVLVPAGSTASGNWGSTGGIPGCLHGSRYSTSYRWGEPGVPLSFSSSAFSSAHPCGWRYRSSGSHAVLFRFYAPQATPGTLVISTSQPKPGLSSYSVDVGNDGSTELASAGGSTPGALMVPITVPAFAPPLTSFDVRVDSAANNGVSSGADMIVNVQFVPGVLFPAYGTGCRIWNGSTFSLAGHYLPASSGGTLKLQAWNGVITSTDPFMIFGLNRLSLAVPPTGCLLLTDIVAAIPVPSSSGRTSFDVPVPAGLSGAQFLVQCIHASPLAAWYTTNGIDVTLP